MACAQVLASAAGVAVPGVSGVPRAPGVGLVLAHVAGAGLLPLVRVWKLVLGLLEACAGL